jgi:transcriptional regulator with XRE-family HTH domain
MSTDADGTPPGGTGDPPDGDGLGADPRSGPTVLRMLLGSQLRRLREDAGITPDRAGYEIRASRSKISRLEHGRVSFKHRDVADLLTLYGVTGERTRAGLLALVEQANAQGWWAMYSDILPDWFEAYLGLEAAATLIRTFELQFVHGLFQTQDYARAVTVLGHKAAPTEEIDRRVSLRLKRQDLLHSQDAPRVWSVMDEAALRRPVGGPQVMRGQLQRLIEAAALPHVTIQVVPFRRGGHAGAGGSFTVLPGRPAGRGLYRAAHQCPVPGKAQRRRPLHGGHEPPVRGGADARGHHPLPQGNHQGNLSPPRPAEMAVRARTRPARGRIRRERSDQRKSPGRWPGTAGSPGQ